jgi:hypothetical protein
MTDRGDGNHGSGTHSRRDIAAAAAVPGLGSVIGGAVAAGAESHGTGAAIPAGRDGGHETAPPKRRSIGSSAPAVPGAFPDGSSGAEREAGDIARARMQIG